MRVELSVSEWQQVVDQLAEGSVKRMLGLIQTIQKQLNEQMEAEHTAASAHPQASLNGAQPQPLTPSP